MDESLKNVRYVLFDLDGTVSDSSEGIMKSVDLALRSKGKEVPYDTLRSFIGPSLRMSFSRYAKDEKERDEMLETYRKRYKKTGWSENVIYDGIAELVRDLKNSGRHVVLASAKPEYFCREILKLFKVDKYFDFIGGADFEGKRDDKTVLMRYVLDNIGNPAPEEVVMIGDRIFDVECAHNNGIKCIGVKYGFAPENELENAGADYIADTVEDLRKLLI